VEPDRAPAVLAELDELRGRPLVSHQVIVDLIGATTTRTGLGVRAELDRGAYPTGVKVSDAELAAVPLTSRYRALVLVGAYGGLRIGELAGLRRSRVDLLRGTVEVAEIVTEVGGRLRVGPPKTRASRRTVGLPWAVVEEPAPTWRRRPHRTPSCSPPQRAGRCG
jgi:integrase